MAVATVVIPTYNRPEHLAGLLNALAEQAEPETPFSVVVVDDGSPTPVRVPGRDLPFDLRIIRFRENRGRAAARNAGIAEVDAPIVVFLDDDIRPLPGFMTAYRKAVNPAERNVGLGQVTFHPDIPRDRLTAYLETRGIAKLGPSDPIPFKYFLTYNSAVPTELLRQVNGFEEKLRTWGGEDLELAWRLHQAGATFVRVPEARAYHAHRRDLDALLAVSSTFGEKSLPLIIRKHPQLIRPLSADLLGPNPLPETRAMRRWFIRALTHPPFPDILRRCISSWPNGPWPMKAFDYLIASAWRKGLDAANSGPRVEPSVGHLRSAR